MLAHLSGEVLGFSYQEDGQAFAVAQILDDTGQEVTITGLVSTLKKGQYVTLSGTWQDHPRHGHQFRVATFLANDPRTINGLIVYLSEVITTGIGPGLAKRIVNHFGLETLEILSQNPEKLSEVPGIGKKRVQQIVESWQGEVQDRELLAGLLGLGISAKLAYKIRDFYGEQALSKINSNPYRLVRDVEGIGFKTADFIAQEIGFQKDHPLRIEALIDFLIFSASDDGHCFLPESNVFFQGMEFGLSKTQIEEGVQRLILKNKLKRFEWNNGFALQLSWMSALEQSVANTLTMMNDTPPRRSLAVCDVELRIGLELSDDQRIAVEKALESGVVVITGGPGTGKTTIVKVLLAALVELKEKWKLCAPTGRAAKRLSEATSVEASTIHRLLEYSPDLGFKRNEENPIEADGVIVDEGSMLDIRLAEALLAAMPPRSRLVIVGDSHQLPPVGAGQVLTDLISSGKIPVAKLQKIHRQASGSGIIVNAHRIDNGTLPISAEKDRSGSPKDFFVLYREQTDDVKQSLIRVITERLPTLGYDPLKDVQVLVPMHQGPLGTKAINELLQNVLNPGEGRFRVNDRVIQTRNNYDLEVFNGETGFVTSVREQALSVNFDDRFLSIVGNQIFELELAYAISVHKSQGSEYPAVILLLHNLHYIMLKRNLLYTAITRASKFCCVIGSSMAIKRSVEQTQSDQRFTRLSSLLDE